MIIVLDTQGYFDSALHFKILHFPFSSSKSKSGWRDFNPQWDILFFDECPVCLSFFYMLQGTPSHGPRTSLCSSPRGIGVDAHDFGISVGLFDFGCISSGVKLMRNQSWRIFENKGRHIEITCLLPNSLINNVSRTRPTSLYHSYHIQDIPNFLLTS